MMSSGTEPAAQIDAREPAAAPRLFAAYSPRREDEARLPPVPGLSIAPANVLDSAELARLLATREGLGGEQAAERVARWFKLPAEAHLLLVARTDEGVLGYGRAAFVLRPTDPEFQSVPQGWYLSGVVVAEAVRRRGIGSELTRQRLRWIAQQANEAFYFVNSLNGASIDLHRRFGFEQIQSNFRFPGAHFSGGGVGTLFRATW